MVTYLKGNADTQIACLRERYRRDNLRLATLPRPFEGAMRAGELLAKNGNRGIFIWGDSDVDGTSATAILLSWCRAHGFPCAFRVVERHRGEAYGLGDGETPARLFAESRLQTFVTVDCGIQDFAGLARVRKTVPDATIIVTDHHLPGGELPPADVVADAWTEASPWRAVCGAATAWLVASIATSRLGEAPDWKKKVLGLVGMATIADVMNLGDDLNATLVRNGLPLLRDMPFCRDLMNVGRFSRLTAEDIAFQIAPRLNAAGRMDSPNILPEFYLGTDCLDTAVHLDYLNSERKRLEREQLATLEDEINAGQVFYFLPEDCHSGLLGVLAGKIVERTGKAACCLRRNAKGFWSGSARIPAGYDLTRQLACVALDMGMLISLKGHLTAAGVALPPGADTNALTEYMARHEDENIERTFSEAERKKLEEYGFVFAEKKEEVEEEIVCATIPPEKITLDLLLEIEEEWGPFGYGFRPPLFRVDGDFTDARRMGEAHIRFAVNGLIMKWWFAARQFQNLQKFSGSVLFTPEINRWNGRENVEGIVRSIIQE